MLKKVNEEQFLLDCINKEHELVGSDLRFDTFDTFSDYTKSHEKWYNDFHFEGEAAFKVWAEYVSRHLFDLAPNDAKKNEIDEVVDFVTSSYGFPVKVSHETAEKKD